MAAAKTFSFKFTGDSKSVEKATKAAGQDLDKFGRDSERVMTALASDSSQAFGRLESSGKSSFNGLGEDGKRAMSGLADDASREFAKVGDEAERGLGRGGAAMSKFKDVIGGAIAGIAVAAAAAGAAVVAGVTSGMRAQAATDKMEGALGLSPEEAKRLGELSSGIYRDAWGDSMEDVNRTIVQLDRNVDDVRNMSDGMVRTLTTGAIDIANTFDQDTNEVLRATGVLMRTGIAKNAEEAFDILTYGFQTGTDRAGDFLDTLIEYAEPMESLGIDGARSVGVLNSALAAGAFNTDKAGDALKELSIRSIDGSKSTTTAYKAIGLDARKMAADIAGGGPAATQATSTIIRALAEMDDAVAQDAAAVALFGMTWEDLGPDVIAALDPLAGELADITNRTEEMQESVNSNVWTDATSIWRTALGTFTDFVTTTFGPTIEAMVPKVQELSERIGEWLEENGPAIQAFVQEKLSQLSGWWDENGPTIIQFATDVKDAIIEIGDGFESAWVEHIEPAAVALGDAWDDLKVAMGELRDAVFGDSEDIKVDWEAVGRVIGGVVAFALITLTWLTNKFTTVMEQAATATDGIKGSWNGIAEGFDAVREAFQTLKDTVRIGINWPSPPGWLKDWWNGSPTPSRKSGSGTFKTSHSGGIVPGASGATVPILAQAGEMVRSAAQVRQDYRTGNGGGGMSIVVNAYGTTGREMVAEIERAVRDGARAGWLTSAGVTP